MMHFAFFELAHPGSFAQSSLHSHRSSVQTGDWYFVVESDVPTTTNSGGPVTTACSGVSTGWSREVYRSAIPIDPFASMMGEEYFSWPFGETE